MSGTSQRRPPGNNSPLSVHLPVLDNVVHTYKLSLVFGGTEGSDGDGRTGNHRKVAFQGTATLPSGYSDRFPETVIYKLDFVN
jgi:hypothetical protein